MTGQRENIGHERPTAMAAERVADIAHDLRAPLGGIDAMIELLASSSPSPAQDRLIQGLRAASAHMRSVASAVISPGGPALANETSVDECLTPFGVASLSRARARELLYRQDIATPCESALISNGTALRQMLENLVDNAFRFTERGVITVRVTPALSSAGAPMIRFDVLDEGPGLTGDQARKIFERGVTLEDRTPGSGLGLSIVADLAERLGGQCGASPRPDRRGAMFWFTMPVVGYREKASPAPVSGQRLLDGLPLLIVDDDATSRMLLKTVLGHLGYETRDTESPCQALEWLEKEKFSGVFTDVSMAEMDGRSFVQAVRSLQGEGARLPVVSVSGLVAPEDRAALKEAGCDASVDKPITIHELRKALLSTGLMATTRCVAA